MKHIVFFLIAVLTSSLFGHGIIIIEPPNPDSPRHRRPAPDFRPFALELKQNNVQVDIESGIATTDVDQIFYNPTRNKLQGYYIFPIPDGAVIDKFTMYINGREAEAELLDADKARKIYEDIVRRVEDPALLEYSGQSMLKMRIFPIEPRAEKRIKLSYSEVLTLDNGAFQYRYPLKSEVRSSGNAGDISIDISISSNGELKNVYCPSHEVDIVQRSAGRVRVSYEEETVVADSDFSLFFQENDDDFGLVLLPHRRGRDDGYFFLQLSPTFDSQADQASPKDITFVLDVSGSMAGQKLEQAKAALAFCVENLNASDRFDIVRFSTQASALFGELAPFGRDTRREAREFIEGLRAIGGTNIGEALDLALGSAVREGRPHYVVFITDGKPTIGEIATPALLRKIEKDNDGVSRIFTFGIGNDINTHLLDKITEVTHGFRSYISPDEDLEMPISSFYTKLSSPILTDIKLNIVGDIRSSDLYPRRLPDLFKGSSITVFGRYRGDGDGVIRVSGYMDGKRHELEREFDFPRRERTNEFIAPLWASRAIGYMLDQIRLHGESRELKEEIVALAREFGIITPYTSYLIVEDERVTRRNRPVRSPWARIHEDAETAPLLDQAGEDYKAMKESSGGGSVRSSEEVQQMAGAQNLKEARAGRKRMSYRSKDGETKNLTQQIKMIQGRAVYQSGNAWIDSRVDSAGKLKAQRIRFMSDEYFALYRAEPNLADFLALGQNVTFVWKNQIYEIYK